MEPYAFSRWIWSLGPNYSTSFLGTIQSLKDARNEKMLLF
jgi:hypothetical protein